MTTKRWFRRHCESEARNSKPIAGAERERWIKLAALLQDSGLILDSLHNRVMDRLFPEPSDEAKGNETEMAEDLSEDDVLDELENILRDARALFGTVPSQMPARFAVRDVLSVVGSRYGVSVGDVLGRSDEKSVRNARNLSMLLFNDVFGLDLGSLCRLFGRKSTAVLRGITDAERRVPKNSDEYKSILEAVGIRRRDRLEAKTKEAADAERV